jgi:NAD kinase
MKLAIVSRSPEKLKKHLKSIQRYKQHISKNPDIIVAIGGDGTFLSAEQQWPGIPKFLIRDQSICNKCDWDNVDEGLKRILAGKYTTHTFSKIKAKVNGITLTAINDIVIRNDHPTHAIRFKLFVDGKQRGGEYIGDGIVISTTFGSEGYFRSITHQHFEKGMGIAFNNTTQKYDPIITNKNAKIVVELTRGGAHIAADNNPDIYVLPEKKRITIQQSTEKAQLVRLK